MIFIFDLQGASYLFGVYAVSGRERVAPNDGGTANFVFVFTVFVGKMLILWLGRYCLLWNRN